MSKLASAWHDPDTDEVFSPKGVMVYPTLLEARGIKGDANSTPKFSVTLLIPKAANIDALKKLAMDTAVEKFGKDWVKKYKLRLPLMKTADQPKLAEHAEAYPVMLRASANEEYPPYLFGPDAKPYLKEDARDIYSGRFAVVTVRAYAYDTAGNKGVAFGLQRVQLLDHGDAIAGGRVATASGFEAVDGADTADAVFDEKKPAGAAAKGADLPNDSLADL